MARAAGCSGGASASGGALALLGGARKLSGRGLTDSELKGTEDKTIERFYSLTSLKGIHIILRGQRRGCDASCRVPA